MHRGSVKWKVSKINISKYNSNRWNNVFDMLEFLLVGYHLNQKYMHKRFKMRLRMSFNLDNTCVKIQSKN